MSYPLLDEIISAARNPIFIKDSFFEGTTIKILPSGRPDMYGGGFSQVFPIVKGNEKWAFKVWHTEIENNRERYNKISAHLKKCKLPYFFDFTYVNDGLLVNGELFDTFRMEWSEGRTLAQYISLNLHNPTVLESLAENFLNMTEQLHQNSISHGDLQHENIFIDVNGEIKLIDYDSICVPELEGQKDICRGRPGYQHPSRHSAGLIASTKIDFFSELVIYLSIRALVENPNLWDQYNAVQAERLLFSIYDFYSFEESPIRADLYLLSPEIQKLVWILERYLAAHILLPPLSSY